MEEINSYIDLSPLGKINFIKYLVEVRKAVTKHTIKGAFRYTGIYPIFCQKVLKHLEI